MGNNWHKWMHWPYVIHNEDQKSIEEIRRAITERRRESLPDGVATNEDEIREMADVVAACGHDPARFLRILHQDSEQYDVSPAAVYERDRFHEGPYWPENGFGLTSEELAWLQDVCCDASEQPDDVSATNFEYSPVERLEELCEFLSYAREIGVPPSLSRGDQ